MHNCFSFHNGKKTQKALPCRRFLFGSFELIPCPFLVTAIHSPPPHGQGPVPPLQSPGGSRNQGMRQMGDVEGVRLVHGNVPVIQDVSDADTAAWRNRRIVPNRKPSVAKYVVYNRDLHGD